MEKIPLVSVIIPMYNSAKFIPQTLESLAYQTMQDFEVLIVDDCSTDNSVEVVEKFARLFQAGIKIYLLELPENTGLPGVVRNVGLQFARGKYIAFLDSDDLFTSTALEELSTFAEEYQADGVHTDEYFVPWTGEVKSADDPAFIDMTELTNPANFSKGFISKYHTDKPIFFDEDIGTRIKKYFGGGGYYSGRPYLTLWRHDFLITQNITFPPIRAHEDQIFGFHALCLTKKILRVPNICYIHRQRDDSISFEQTDMEASIHKFLRIYIDGFNFLRKIMGDIKFFAEQPNYRYRVLNWYVSGKLTYLQPLYEKISPALFSRLIEKELSGDDAAFAAYLFNTVNIQRLQIMRLQQELNKFQKQ